MLVGLPSRDTYSLPFAHRQLFRDHANDFDLFVYAEDDTLITPANIRAFLDVQQHLRDDEIVGFLRSETSPDGIRFIVSANSHFRWLPDSAFSRGAVSLREVLEPALRLLYRHAKPTCTRDRVWRLHGEATQRQIRHARDGGERHLHPVRAEASHLPHANGGLHRSASREQVLSNYGRSGSGIQGTGEGGRALPRAKPDNVPVRPGDPSTRIPMVEASCIEPRTRNCLRSFQRPRGVYCQSVRRWGMMRSSCNGAASKSARSRWTRCSAMSLRDGA